LIIRKGQVIGRRLGKVKHFTDFAGNPKRASRGNPVEHVEQPTEQGTLGAQAVQHVGPIELVAGLIKQVEQVRPVAAVALEDVKLDGEEFFGGQDREIFPAEDYFLTASEPLLVTTERRLGVCQMMSTMTSSRTAR
jgi:hypothetical protein